MYEVQLPDRVCGGVQYVPKRHLDPADLPKPPTVPLRARHLPPTGQSPSSSRSANLKGHSMSSLPSIPSLESQASPPFPHLGKHPLHRWAPPLLPPARLQTAD